MAKDSYFPTEDNKVKDFLENLNLKLSGYAALFSISAAQLASLNDDTLNFSYWLGQVNLFTTEKEERVSYKNRLREGPIGSPAGVIPSVPVVPAPPAPVQPGIEPRTRVLVQFVKNNPFYTDTIGKDLGVIGDEQSVQRSSLKPVFRLEKLSTGINIIWKKGTLATGVRIEKQVVSSGGIPVPAPAPSASASWSLLAIDTQPDYLDTTPITGAAIWRYRLVYMIGDEQAGQWSDEASIAVG